MSSSSKRRRSCPFSSSSKRSSRKKVKTLSTEAAHALAESDRGSYYDQGQIIESEVSKDLQPEVSSASHSKIRKLTVVKETEGGAEKESWQSTSGQTLVNVDTLQQKISESMSCRYCQNEVELTENVSGRRGFGSTWLFVCKNEQCSSHMEKSAFPTTARDNAFEVNKGLVLGLQNLVSDFFYILWFWSYLLFSKTGF